MRRCQQLAWRWKEEVATRSVLLSRLRTPLSTGMWNLVDVNEESRGAAQP